MKILGMGVVNLAILPLGVGCHFFVFFYTGFV